MTVTVLPPPTYASRLLDPFMEGRDVPNTSLRDDAGVSAGSVPEQRVDAPSAHRLLEAARDRAADATFALRAGMNLEGGVVDLFLYLLRSAPSPRSAVGLVSEHARLLADTWKVSLDVLGKRAYLWIESDPGTPACSDDLLLGLLIRPTLLGRLSQGPKLILRHALPKDAQPYHSLLGDEPQFLATVSGLSFDASHLDRIAHDYDPRLHRLLRKLADQDLRSLPSPQTWAARVRHAIGEELAGRAARLERVAQTMGVHPRKLARLLTEEGTTFQDVVDDVRRSRSLEWLAEGELSIMDVARRLGYQSRPVFHRAFRRWTGRTPSDYRRAARDKQSFTDVVRPTPSALAASTARQCS